MWWNLITSVRLTQVGNNRNDHFRYVLGVRVRLIQVSSKGLFTWSGGPRSSGVGFFCFDALGDTKQKKPTPLEPGPPLHVNRVLIKVSFKVNKGKRRCPLNTGFTVIDFIECFHSRGEHPCKFIGTKESVCIRKEFNSHRIGLGHQHGRRFIVLGHKYGRRYVM